ncbi:ATP-binding protein [Aquabacterium sp.]|uniref:ATP-binding protein n=1 Tax=Aquabacterium sp. TaxID=1872578 RepID=UPI003784C8DB
MAIALHLFGAPSLVIDGSAETLPFERRHQLLACLALRGGWVPRSELAALLWPEQPDKLAYTNVRKALHRLQELPWAPAIESQGNALKFDAATDVAAFEQALREGRSAEALALRRGEFLAGFDDSANEAWTQWLQQERDRLRSLWRGAALDLLPTLDEPARRIALSAEVLGLDAFDEAALRLHAQALLQAGQPARAAAAWQDFVARLRQELEVEPSAELRAWHAQWSGRAASGVPAAAPAAPRSAADDGFIGRSAELQRIRAWLQPGGCRLLTLLGPGGIGKTRLARQALDELEAGHADGAVFVPLEDLPDATQIAPRLAREMSVPLAGRGEALAELVAALKPRQLLLVLDNLEHLAGAPQLLARLLQACPGLTVIATSRVRLALAEEQLFPLQGLPCPDAEDEDRLEAFDATRLFIRAAQRVEPGFAPAAEGAAIAEICRLVDGLPLALELAAAWTRAMPCAAIADELRRGTELLSTADPTRPARQASIAAVFEQSWSQLGEAERRALAALSVCRGGFSAAAARQVAGASPPVLASLADRSLLRKADGGRLQLHPLLQQFAAERLAPGPEQQQAATAHAEHYLNRLATLAPLLRRADREAMRETDLEFENLRAAWVHAAQAGLCELIGRSAVGLMHHCDHRGRAAEGRGLLADAAQAPALALEPRVQARLLAYAAHLAYRLDRYEEAIIEAEALLATEAGNEDQRAWAQCHRLLGAAHLQLGRLDRARIHFGHAHEAAVESGDTLSAAGMLDNRAIVEKHAGRYDEALRLSQAALVMLRRAGAHANIALCLNHLGTLHLVRQDLDAAQAHFEEGLALCEREGLVGTQGYLLANLADTALDRGDLVRAQALAERNLAASRLHGYKSIEIWMLQVMARLALRRGHWAEARQHTAAALQLALALGAQSLLSIGLLPLAETLEAQGERPAARRVLALAARHPLTTAPDRDRMRRTLALWGEPADDPPLMLTLEELVHRTIAGAATGYGALLAPPAAGAAA